MSKVSDAERAFGSIFRSPEALEAIKASEEADKLVRRTNAAAEARSAALARALEEAKEALEPFAQAADVSDDCPAEMAALRPAFDYPMRTRGRDNDEIIGQDSIRVSHLRTARESFRRARTILEAPNG